MKDLGKLTVLLLVSALLVLAIHAALVSYTEAHPVPVYYEEAPAPTPTYYDPYPASNYSSYYYPYPGYYPTNTYNAGPTPTMQAHGNNNIFRS